MRSQGRCWQRQGLKEGLARVWYIAQVNRKWYDRWVTFQKVGTPKVKIAYCIKTDVIAHRDESLTGEAC